MINETTKKSSKKNAKNLFSRIKWWLNYVYSILMFYSLWVAFSAVTWYYYVPYLEIFYWWLYLDVVTAG